jgi:hypothetical protein
VEYLNRRHDEEPVLFVETVQVAGLRGRPYTNSWYHYSFDRKLQEADSIDALQAILREAGIRYLVTPVPQTIPQMGLAELAARYATVEQESGPYQLRVLHEQPVAPRAMLTLGSGRFDDSAPGIEYSASWRRQGGFPLAAGGGVTYSDRAGATVRVRFRGTGIVWTHTRAPNRGQGRVSVDGGEAVDIDLRAADAAWQSVHRITGLPPGEHTLRIEVAGDGFVDADAFEILNVPGERAVMEAAQQR